jgi:hypothetical protein
MLIGLLAIPCLQQRVMGQDSFEIQVYQFETVPRKAWELETHFNYTATGTRMFEGTVAPTEHQSHLAFEATRGITDRWEVGGYIFTAYRPGGGFEFAGGRLRTRARLPETWHLPVRIALNGELSSLRSRYEESALTLEFTPIFEGHLGPVRLDLNTSSERDLKGPDKGEWEFEPSARAGIRLSDRVGVGLEYFAALGELDHLLPRAAQVHQFYPSIDFKLGDHIEWNVGVGVGATSAGNQFVLKTRFELLLGGKDSD